MWNTFSVCLSCSAESATEAISLALHSVSHRLKSMWNTVVGIKNWKQIFSLRLAFTTQKKATHIAEVMPVLCVAIFLVVNASSGEKSCLQFSIPTGSGVGGEGGVSHSLKVRWNTDQAAMSARDSWIFLDNFSTSFWWYSVIKIVRWFKLINSSNHLTIFLVEFRRKLVEKLFKKIVRLCRRFTFP